MANKVTPKQRNFCDEYLMDLNATAAAIRAGYSAKNADKIGPELLGKTRVKEYIAECMADRAERVQINQDDVLRELITIAMANVTDFVKIKANDEGQKVVDILETVKMDPSKIAAIAEIRQSKEGFISIKMCDKLKALELLGRHLGMFTDNLNVNGTLNIKKLEDYF